jgi:hypothetical protein
MKSSLVSKEKEFENSIFLFCSITTSKFSLETLIYTFLSLDAGKEISFSISIVK